MKFIYPTVCTFFRIYFTLLYRLKVYGKNNLPKGPALIAANHVSYFDPPIIGASTSEELNFLARESLFKYPRFGWLIRQLNSHPISGTTNDLSSFKLICRLVEEGKKVVIFPEGSRSPTGNLMDIRPGVGMLAQRCKAPIIPTYISGAFEVWPITQKFPKPWGKIRCIFGNPIYSHSYEHLERKQAQEAIAQDVGRAINQLRQWYEEGAYGTLPH